MVEVLKSIHLCVYLSKIDELQNAYVLTEIIILSRPPNSNMEWHYEKKQLDLKNLLLALSLLLF